LRFYDLENGAAALSTIDISGFFENRPKEIDIEGSTLIDGKAFWITSHGRNKDGEFRPQRHQLFATEVEYTDHEIRVSLVGSAYTKFLRDILKDQRFQKFNLKKAETLAPEKRDALNIEGLTTTPDKKLLIGFRNPVPKGKALIIPLENPHEVISGKTAVFGNPIELDLGGNGVRSIEYSEVHKMYLIVAGPYNNEVEFSIYSWSGKEGVAPKKLEVDLRGINPEAALFIPESGTRVLLLSDDGDNKEDGTKCKDLEEAKRHFRSVLVPIQH
jgi:hypothetical protein